jgi:glycerol uptake facilitator protein
MSALVSEFFGTTLLVLLGTSVVANCALKKSYGYGSGIVAITLGWGMAVFIGASVAHSSGGHINPAVTLTFAVLGKLAWSKVPAYLLGQFLGAMFGAYLTYLAYKEQFKADETGKTLGIFSTIPVVRNYVSNFITECIGTFVLLFWILQNPAISLGQNNIVDFGNSALGYAAVMFVVVGIGLSLGGPTGYAINPARDLGPRIVYSLLPLKKKQDPDWSYAYIPIVAPLLGGLFAAIIYKIV